MQNLSGTFTPVESIIIGILTNQMADILEPQNAWVTNQNFTIPNDEDKLFVSVGMVSSKVLTNSNTAVPTETGMQEIQEVVEQETIQIDIMSRDNSALNNRFRILMALNSIYSKQQQENYYFKIFKIPTTFVNTSETEGTSNINKLSITINAHVWYRKVVDLSATDYYNDFSVKADIEEQQSIIEFNIKEE